MAQHYTISSHLSLAFHPRNINLVLITRKKSTSRYTLRPPIILFIQHNEFICLEGSQLIKNIFLYFSVVFLLSILSRFLLVFTTTCCWKPLRLLRFLLSLLSLFLHPLKTHAYKNSWKKSLWQKNVYESWRNALKDWVSGWEKKGERKSKSSRAYRQRRCYYIKLTTKHIYVLGISRTSCKKVWR